MSFLQDFKSVKIFVKSGDGLQLLGKEVFDKLKQLKNKEGIKGVYFTHYLDHIKVGFRYTNWSVVEQKINDFLNSIRSQNVGLIRNIGEFELTEGSYYLLPKEVMSDYLVCQAFGYLLKLEQDVQASERDAQRIAYWFLENKEQIFEEIVNGYNKEFTEQEIFWILERFIHHLLNAAWLLNIEPIIFIFLIGAGFFKK